MLPIDVTFDTGEIEYCSESKKLLIFLEKVYTVRSLRFCGTDFHRSSLRILLNNIFLDEILYVLIVLFYTIVIFLSCSSF